VRGELAVANATIAAQERTIEGAQRREEVWRDLIYQEKGEKRALIFRGARAVSLCQGGITNRLFLM